ncbi:MAG: translocation/assembly module TamB domain-containing protein [Bacteroidales bacterium]
MFIFILYGSVYIILSVPSIQKEVTQLVSRELSVLLDTHVQIREVKPELFNKIALKEVVIKDKNNLTLLNANKIAANLNLKELLNRRLIINTVQLFSFEGHIYRENPTAPTNLDFIIEKLKPKKQKKKKGLLEIQLRTILIRRGNLTYDVFSEENTPETFNPHHVNISNLLASVSIKSISKDSVNADVKRISFNEKSGFELRKLSFSIKGNRDSVHIPAIRVTLPSSFLNIENISIDMSKSDSLRNRKSLFKFDKHLISDLKEKTNVHLDITSSFINTSDIAPLLPVLKSFPATVTLDAQLDGTADSFKVSNLMLNARELLYINLNTSVNQLFSSNDPYYFLDISDFYLTPEFSEMLLHRVLPKNSPYRNLGEENGITKAKLSISGFRSDLVAHANIKSQLANLDVQATVKETSLKDQWNFSGQINGLDIALNDLIKGKTGELFGNLNTWFDFKGTYTKGQKPRISVNGEFFDFDFKDYTYNNLKFGAKLDHNSFTGGFLLNDLNGYIQTKLDIENLNKPDMTIHSAIEVNGLNTDAFHFTRMNKNTSFSGKINSTICGKNVDIMSGFITIDSLLIENDSDTAFVDKINILADQTNKYKKITISSPLLSGDIRGEYSLKELPAEVMAVISKEIPALIPKKETKRKKEYNSHMIYSLCTGDLNPLLRVFSVNADISRPIALNGFIDSRSEQFNLSLIAPRLKIGKNLIDQGQLYAHNNTGTQVIEVKATTYNKKRIPTNITLNVSAKDDSIKTNIQAYNTSLKTFGGELDLMAVLDRDEKKQLYGCIDMHPTKLIINDTIWNIAPAHIDITPEKIFVENFRVSHQDQYVKIEGVASKADTDSLHLQLKSINLDYIFELLNVANVHFGGYASGDFALSKFEKMPHISTDNFAVKNFSFNNALLGNLKLHSSWDASNSGILMKGNISENENISYVDGYIFPTKDSLDLKFDAKQLNIGFINQFVSSIFSKFGGKATGNVRLFGRFSKLALDGSALLENIKLGIGYTNTEYTINDMLYLEPERIYFENISLTDTKGNKGKASGELTHQGFKNIKYDISLYPDHMLVFDTNKKLNDLFFGTIFATGKGTIKGDESNVNISMNGKSEANSSFTFSLSNSATASEYRFLTFTDKSDSKPEDRHKLADKETDKEESSANINIDLQMDVTPDAKLTLIMDETTGDEIQTTGTGSLRLNFNTKSDDVKLYGTYTIEKGNYFFNLQNLFVREFLIENGSSVIFRGNPMAAELKINAIYALTANLTDLDESFINDKELSRTNVPVQCQLNISGEMLQPELDFNIWLPSNSDDINRKVKSIIGTPEMMNQQIIYLLLLNKFYTPDYMNAGQRNELSAIASSTISSQLNNILRQVSNNWNLGTNIKSDKGDFSDIEVELALSSQLLNNRLLINGNFGYKDNPKSQTNFIGDIDAEYKLTKSGNLRLKGYNKTNDRYYYIKSAVTTQGLGLIYKKDFDKILDLFRSRKFKKKKKEDSVNDESSLQNTKP